MQKIWNLKKKFSMFHNNLLVQSLFVVDHLGFTNLLETLEVFLLLSLKNRIKQIINLDRLLLDRQ